MPELPKTPEVWTTAGLFEHIRKEGDQPALARVKGLVETGYETPFREKSRDWLSGIYYRLEQAHKRVGDAVSDPAQLSTLENDANWSKIEPFRPTSRGRRKRSPPRYLTGGPQWTRGS